MKLSLWPVLRRLWSRSDGRPGSIVPAEPATPAAVEASGAEHRRLQAIVEAADDGLVACDAAGRLTLVNPAAAGLLEIGSVRALDAAEWPAGAEVVRPALSRALLDGYATLELEVERAGRLLVLEARANPTRSAGGQVDGAVAVLRDVTRQRELVAAHSGDWSSLAHDLKTPLNSIGGFSTLLLQEAVGPLNPLQRDFLRTIEQEGQRLLAAVQCFLEEARGTRSEERLECVQLGLEALVRETVERLHSLAVRKSLTVAVDLTPDLPVVEADRDKIATVLMNLLDNAISFSRDGSQIRVAAREVRDALEISVQDAGAGIPPESLPLVFDRFYRAANQPSGRPGIGLGLAICKQYVEQHGGRIWAESGPEGGARLAFTLPIAYRQARLEALEAAW